MKKVKKSAISTLLLSLIAVLTAIMGAEVLARAIGFKPAPVRWRHENEPVMFEPDPQLGWRTKAGEYVYPAYHPGDKPIHATFLSDGRRKTQQDEYVAKEARPKILFVGGSFTQGWAISDHETFAWKIQEQFQAYEVINYGTAAYGTYQSILKLERDLKHITDVEFIVYGFHDHHETRNVAMAEWWQMLRTGPRRGFVSVPFVTLDRNRSLIRQESEGYPSWPFRHRLAIIALAERALLNVQVYRRSRQGRSATKLLIKEMQELSNRNRARLVVSFLSAADDAKSEYKTFFADRGIASVDCRFILNKRMQVRDEGHPNGEMNTKWAHCISSYLADFIGN